MKNTDGFGKSTLDGPSGFGMRALAMDVPIRMRATVRATPAVVVEKLSPPDEARRIAADSLLSALATPPRAVALAASERVSEPAMTPRSNVAMTGGNGVAFRGASKLTTSDAPEDTPRGRESVESVATASNAEVHAMELICAAALVISPSDVASAIADVVESAMESSAASSSNALKFVEALTAACAASNVALALSTSPTAADTYWMSRVRRTSASSLLPLVALSCTESKFTRASEPSTDDASGELMELMVLARRRMSSAPHCSTSKIASPLSNPSAVLLFLQEKHFRAPSNEKDPLSQCVHALAPREDAVPAVQFSGSFALSGQKLPSGHSLQSALCDRRLLGSMANHARGGVAARWNESDAVPKVPAAHETAYSSAPKRGVNASTVKSGWGGTEMLQISSSASARAYTRASATLTLCDAPESPSSDPKRTLGETNAARRPSKADWPTKRPSIKFCVVVESSPPADTVVHVRATECQVPSQTENADAFPSDCAEVTSIRRTEPHDEKKHSSPHAKAVVEVATLLPSVGGAHTTQVLMVQFEVAEPGNARSSERRLFPLFCTDEFGTDIPVVKSDCVDGAKPNPASDGGAFGRPGAEGDETGVIVS